jgi:hypothetical protein
LRQMNTLQDFFINDIFSVISHFSIWNKNKYEYKFTIFFISMINIIFRNNTIIRILAIELLNIILIVIILMIKSLLIKLMVCLDNFSVLFSVP